MRKDTARNATPGEPPGDRSRLGGRIRAEAVVDDQRNDTAITRSGPTVEQDGQRQAVGTTGTGNGKLRRRFERTERRHPCGHFGGFDGLLPVAEPAAIAAGHRRQEQPSWPISDLALEMTRDRKSTRLNSSH